MPKFRQQSPYDTVFDFIFGEYKPKGRRGKPGQPIQMPPLTGIEGVLGQIASAPFLYPTNKFLKDLDTDIDTTGQWRTEPVKGAEIKIGPSSIFKLIGDPRGFIEKSFEGYEQGKRWGKWGAVTRGMDGAMVSIMAKWAGFGSAAAIELGSGISDLNKINPATAPVGQISGYQVQRNLVNRLSSKGARDFSGQGITKEDIQKIIMESAKEGRGASRPSYEDKLQRRHKVITELVARGVSAGNAESFATEVWGTHNPTDDRTGNDLGIWLHKGDEVKEIDPTDPKRKRKITVKGHFNNEEDLRQKSAKLTLQLIQEEKAKYPSTSREYAKLNALESLVNRYITKNDPFFGLGRSIGNSLYYWGTFKEYIVGGKAVNAILWGNARDLQKTFIGFGINPDQHASVSALIKSVEVFHPLNFVPGILWNGKFWEYLASKTSNTKTQDKLNFVTNLTPKKVLDRIGSFFVSRLGIGTKSIKDTMKGQLAKIASRFLGVNAKDLLGVSIKEILKQVISKLITQVLGNALLPGIGVVAGFLADQIINLTMKLAKPMVEFIVLLFLGALVLLIMLCGTGASMLDRFHRHLNLPLSATYASADLASDSTAPAGMNTCPVGGGITCTQGPCGSTSHSSKTPGAVDLKWDDMAMNPNLVAPANVTVVYAKAVHHCADGSEAGGYMVFRDEYGYTWTVVHVRPLVGVGGKVNAGDPIAVVQMGAEIPVSPNCWTGPHAHLQIKDPSGKSVNAQIFLNSAGCSFMCPAGDECN